MQSGGESRLGVCLKEDGRRESEDKYENRLFSRHYAVNGKRDMASSWKGKWGHEGFLLIFLFLF